MFASAKTAPCAPCAGVLDVASGAERAAALGWFDYRSFDVDEFRRLEADLDITWALPTPATQSDTPLRQI